MLCSERPDPARVFELIGKYRPTILFSVPTIYAAMLRAAEGGLSPDISSLRVCMSAGESLPKTLFDQWKARFGIELFDGIGSTEAGNIFITNRAGEIRGGSAGKVVTGYEVKIVDDNYQEVPRGVVGNLKLKSDGIAAGYWIKHDKTKKTFVGEWLFTGDQFSLDEDGFYWYSGRSDDMIKVGGIWVSPIEIEGILLQYPGVQECAVVGVMDRDGLIKLTAFVVLKPGNQPGEEMTRLLRDFVKTKAASYKAPRWINYVTELPMTASGKIQRYKLREMSGKLLSS